MQLTAAVCDRARIARDARFDGRFFIAVLSTGIYCRPICPSPHARRENVRYFLSAAEAVAAGFRACLRCRPEAAPGTPRWKGTASTVSRALRLIEEGTLQEQSLAELARRLGVSARQLHRLFAIHLGASPTAVAKTWRLNFARRLLCDTDLPMSRVAMSAGFRTVRRFNAEIREVYGRTPSQLRLQPDAVRPGCDDYVLRLPYRAPFDWESLLAFLEARAIPGVEEVVAGAYRRAFAQDGRHCILEVRHEPRGRAVTVRVRSAEPVSLLPIASRVRGVFDLAADTADVARHLRKDPQLRPLIDRRPGLRVPGAWDPFEMAIRAILGESLAESRPSELEDLVRTFGERLGMPDSGGLTNIFPTPPSFARARLDRIRPAAARAIRSAAETAISRLDEETLRGVAGLDASAVGYIALRAFREPDAFPSDDAALTALSERWRPWRAYAAVHLARAAAERASPALERSVKAG
jgi:AraC family transcriptional regulator, regulatory protein of adaptative response / DNA-3-methyladenine glycosylase II